MALQDHLTEEKAALTALLESEYANQNMRDSLLQRLYYIRFLLGELSSTDGGGNVSVTSSVLPTGAATSALQSNVQADAGVNATKAIAIQGISDGQPVIFSAAHVKHVESQLIAAPSSTVSRNMDGYNKAFIQVIVANINTSVTLRIEGSNDNSNWVNLSASNTDTTITANGVYAFQYIGCPQHIRTTFVSELGGSSATIDVITRLSA